MLYLLRGPSGSGKTTFANTLLKAGIVDHVFEADDWMVDDTGNYKHDRSRLKYCHAECQRRTKQALERGENVAVANTLTKRWEVECYTQMTPNVTVITMEGRFPNVHDVPEDIVALQRVRMERWHK
nr:AAA family ATPase [Ruegeria sp. HKCCSP346]